MVSPERPWCYQVTAYGTVQGSEDLAPLLPTEFSIEEKEQGARPLFSHDLQGLSEKEFQLIRSQSWALLLKDGPRSSRTGITWELLRKFAQTRHQSAV